MEARQRKQPFTGVSSLYSLAKYLLNDYSGSYGTTYGNNTNYDYSMLHSTIINAYHNPHKFQDELINLIENDSEFSRFNWFLTSLKNNDNYILNVRNQAKSTYDNDPVERHIDRPLDFLFMMFLWMYIYH
jgi:hypothetical protein